MYNIYFDKRTLSIEKAENIDNGYNGNAEDMIYFDATTNDPEGIVDYFSGSTRIRKLLIASENPDRLFKRICGLYKEINAGGGIVRNAEGRILMIFRNGFWDFPKGKQEKGEDIETTAGREICEECGLDSVRTGKLICVTHHTYTMEGKNILKHTYWYEAEYTGKADLVPQTEENIEKAVWVTVSEAASLVKDTYPSIREVFGKYASAVISGR